MRTLHLLPLLWICSTVIPIQASELGEDGLAGVERLIAIIDTAAGKNDQDHELIYRLVRVKSAIQCYVVEENSDELVKALEEIPRQAPLPPAELIEAAGKLKRAIAESKKEADEREISFLKELNVRIAETVLNAETASELDPFLHELAEEVRTDKGRFSSPIEARNLRWVSLSHGLRFAQDWQEHILHLENDRYDNALKSLKSSEYNGRRNQLDPEIFARRREEILAMQADREMPVDFVLDRVKNLDDLAFFMSDWARLMNNEPENIPEDVTTLVAALEEIATAHQCFRNGQPFAVEFLATPSQSEETELPDAAAGLIAKLKLGYASAVLPTHLDLPEEHSQVAGAGLPEYLDNLIASCREQGDIDAVSRTRQLSNTLGMPREASHVEEWAGHHYRSALRAIEAGQTRMAAQSLHATLRTGNAPVITGRAEELLDQLERDHPEECRRALTAPFMEATTHGIRAAVRFVLPGEQASKEVEQIRKAVQRSGGVIKLNAVTLRADQ